MYRLLKNASTKVNCAKLSKLQLNQTSLLPCSLCNREFLPGTKFIPSRLWTRNLTTEELTALRDRLKKKKKYRKSKKKFTELLEVHEDKSNTTKATVKTLTGQRILQFAEQPEITLEHLQDDTPTNTISNESTLCNVSSSLDNSLFKQEMELIQHQKENIDIIPEISSTSEEQVKSKNDMNVFPHKKPPNIQKNKIYENVTPSSVNDFLLDQEIEKEMEFKLTQYETNEIKPEIDSNSKQPIDPAKKSKKILPPKKLENPETIKKNKIMLEKEQQYIIEKFNDNLVSYIDLCVHCEDLNVGFGTLSRYSNKNARKNIVFSLRSARPFNSLMHGYARKANIDKIMELLRMMRSCGVSSTPQSYAAAFEALGRRSSDETVIGKLKFLEEEMKSKSFTFQHLFEHCSYIADQRECVLKSIHRLDPDFVPHYNPPVLHYNCALIKELNKKSHQPYTSPCHGLISKEEMEECVNQQMKIELSSPVIIKSVVPPPAITKEIEQNRAKWNELQDLWKMSIQEALDKKMENLKTELHSTKLCYGINIYPYLKALTAEEFVDIILLEIRKMVQGSETFSPNLDLLQKNLGHQVRLKYQIKHKQQYGIMSKIEKIYKSYCNWYLNPETNPTSLNTRQQWQQLLHTSMAEGASLEDKEGMWPANIIKEIGRFLYSIITKKIEVDVNCFKSNSTPEYLPAFCTVFRSQGNKLFEELKPHPHLVKLFKESYFDELFFDVNLLPMVSPPVPWISAKSGGYVIAKADFVRLHYGVSNKIIEELAPQRLYPVFDSLNQLSAVPWRINEKVLDVVMKVFREGGSARLDIPQDMSSYVPTDLPFEVSNGRMTFEQKSIFDRKKGEMYALWCEALYRLSLANHFRKRIFWLPHNTDFRGRTYPVPPHLTHLSNDMARSLLWFAKGMKLGPKGLDWLKIHCVNLTGLKKRHSLADRLKYANEILPDILDSAEKPLTGKMWWAESEEQWQTLACCMEIKAAIDSGDAENFISNFPVHQDGSCNGLQHYAALGRDQAGAESVNLTPCEAPQDVYSCVVNLVEAERAKDAMEGLEIAKKLEGFVKRKVIKQTIMTTVYGVTRYGAKAQIAKQLKDIEEFPKHLVGEAASYLSKKTFYCLQTMFTSSRQIQEWLSDCAKFISVLCVSNVEWQTPMGLPVVQPYSNTRFSKMLNDKNGQLNNLSFNVVVKPNAVKQRNAFPPNFIHSLDSSHMMLTSLFCERQGITFVSVHDCFWTHPCTVDEMNKICREQFVALHSEPILENLSKYLVKKFSNAYSFPANFGVELPHAVLEKVPPKGTFDLESVLKSTYFFS